MKKNFRCLKEGYLESHMSKNGVRIVVYNKPRGNKNPFKKKYRTATGMYLLMRIASFIIVNPVCS